MLHGVSFDSLEEAARGSKASADVLAYDVSPDGRWGVAVVDKGSPGALYVYQVICERHPDGWQDYGLDGNIYGYTALPQPIEPDSDGEYTGIVTCWGEAPAGSSSVTIEWQGQRYEVPVRDGWFLFVRWHVPEQYVEPLPRLI